jgi:hypothetical protein
MRLVAEPRDPGMRWRGVRAKLIRATTLVGAADQTDEYGAST